MGVISPRALYVFAARRTLSASPLGKYASATLNDRGPDRSNPARTDRKHRILT